MPSSLPSLPPRTSARPHPFAALHTTPPLPRLPCSYYNSAIRVRQTWVSNSDSLFLSFRTKHNGDAWLADNLAAKVHIYSAPISSQQDSDPTTWRAALAGEGGGR